MRNKIVIFVAAILAMALAGAALAQPDHLFFAELSGANENPPVNTDTTGEAKFRLSRGGDTLQFELKIEDGEDIITGAGAHIHCGGPTANGPIAAYLAAGSPAPGFDGDIQLEASLNDQNVEPTPCGGTLEELVASMRAGNTYVNVHSAANPGGEIRGQIGPPGSR